MGDDRTQRAESIVGHRFARPELLAEALTHPSAAAETPGASGYDRLEFLGDAVLGFLVSQELYRLFPEASEGELTARKHAAVSGEVLATVARELGLEDLVTLGRGAEAAGERSRASVLENALEALVGALYLDGGLDVAGSFALRVLRDRFTSEAAVATDPKSALQQVTQSRAMGLPEYRIVDAVGPPHLRTFSAEVLIGGVMLGAGHGPSKQAAEKAAAAEALRALQEAPEGR